MSSFAFLPRSISKQKGNSTCNSHVRRIPDSDPGPSITKLGRTLAPVIDQPPRPTQPDDNEWVTALELSLSDYAFWCAPHLQYKMKMGQDGYIPMQWLLASSIIYSSKNATISEIELIRCLRSSTAPMLEARMLMAEPSRKDWFVRGDNTSGTSKSHSGGFEIRRTDWESVLRKIESNEWTKEWWDLRTVYIERLPVAFRSIPAVARYIESLLTSGDEELTSLTSRNLVQSVRFPSHYSAAPEEVPRCKGFAFVVLTSPELVARLTRDYPWEGKSEKSDLNPDAVKFGLRTLPKPSWDVSKAEYLAYQKRLLAQSAEEAIELEASTFNTNANDTSLEEAQPSPPPAEDSYSTWYPKNCLVFVKNVHPETNKTTLRALFKDALSGSGGDVDYVDFNKGVDSCHLRLASPSDTAHIVSHFESKSVAQRDPLDQVGSLPTEGRTRIILEMVQGKREEFYWEKVPEKVRNAAMERLTGRRRKSEGFEEYQGRERKRRK